MIRAGPRGPSANDVTKAMRRERGTGGLLEGSAGSEAGCVSRVHGWRMAQRALRSEGLPV